MIAGYTFLTQVLSLLNTILEILGTLQGYYYFGSYTPDTMLNSVSECCHITFHLIGKLRPASAVIDTMNIARLEPQIMTLIPVVQIQALTTYPGLELSLKIDCSSIQYQEDCPHPFLAHLAGFKCCFTTAMSTLRFFSMA